MVRIMRMEQESKAMKRIMRVELESKDLEKILRASLERKVAELIMREVQVSKRVQGAAKASKKAQQWPPQLAAKAGRCTWTATKLKSQGRRHTWEAAAAMSSR